MAIIKKSELKQMTPEQMTVKLHDLKSELMKIRAQISTKTTLENPGRVRVVKKTIAKLHTFIRQKKAQKVSPSKVSKKKTQEVRKQ